jgi:multidrug resistance efflux pump
MKRKLAVVAIVLAVAGLAAWIVLGYPRRNDTTGQLRVSGMVEATTVDVAPEIAGTVVELPVREGQPLQRGQLIATLDTAIWQARLAAAQAQERQAAELALQADKAVGVEAAASAAAIAEAQATRDAAAANLAKLRSGSRPQEIAVAKRGAEEAAAGVQAAQARLDKLSAGLRPQEIEEARARAASAQAQAEQALRDWQRMWTLAEQGAVSAQTAEAARTAHDSARAAAEVAQQQLSIAEQGARSEDIAAAEADLRRARQAHEAALEQLSLVQEGPRREDVAAGRANLARAQAAVSAAQAQARHVEVLRQQAAAARAQQRAAQAAVREADIMLDKTRLYSPLDGVVQTKVAEAGDTVNPGGPVVRMIDLSDVWLRVYVPETVIGRVKVGQPVKVTIDSYPGREFDGAVESISSEAEFTPKYVQTPSERTRLVYGVKVGLDNRDHVFKPGMPADAVIELGAEAGGSRDDPFDRLRVAPTLRHAQGRPERRRGASGSRGDRP